MRRDGHRSPRGRTTLPPNGGSGVIRGVTRRRHAASHLLMLQNPHRRRCGRYCEAGETGGDCTAWPRRCAAGPGRTTSRRAEHTSATQPHWCGGRRRDQRARASCKTRGLAAVPVGGGRARAGLEIDHSEPQARVWRSRGRAAAHRHTQRPGPSRQATRRPEHQRARGRAAAHGHTKQPGPSRQATRRPEHQRTGRRPRAHRAARHTSGARNTSGAQATSTHTKTPTRNRVGVSEPPVGIEPTTYSLRVNRSAD